MFSKIQSNINKIPHKNIPYKIIIIFIGIILSSYVIINFSYKNNNNIHYLNLKELINFNYQLYHINASGFVDLHENNTNLLVKRTSDPLMIKSHRKLHKKYGKIAITFIGTNKNYYILDNKLATQILNDSPKIFETGNFKMNLFNKVMPLNVGVSTCISEGKCPWKRLRKFNEKVLGSNQINNFFYCINGIVEKYLTSAPRNVYDFKELAFNITNQSLFGNHNLIPQLKSFLACKVNVRSEPFFKEYINKLKTVYQTDDKCNLLYYAKINKDTLTEQEFIDQIPHWFGPMLFMISYLIPGLLCLVLNLGRVHTRLLKEINMDDFDIMNTNTYLHYCVIEHIRLFNTINANMQRSINQDLTYNNINFKKGDQIFILHSSLLRDENKFPNPDSFIPERWENSDLVEQHTVFSVGPQQCVSRNITPLYYKIIIYQLLRKFDYDTDMVIPKLSGENLYFINPYEIKLSSS